MGRRRAGNCSNGGSNRRAWTAMEDKILTEYIKIHGAGQWNYLPEKTGLVRCGKSCRLRWLNYLKPGVKRGNITQEEEDIIIRLHQKLGNRWSLIAERLPGRTDNEVKNYWYTKISKKIKHDHHCDGDSTAPFISNPRPSNYCHDQSLEGQNQNLKVKHQGLCEVLQPSQNKHDETTRISSPEEAREKFRDGPVAAEPRDVYGVVQYEHFETMTLSPVMILEENYYQLLHDDVWIDFQIWNNLS
ncbi:hypothetical protein TIFTF001_006368 [Ficus carica]|uniref:Uncharacterized protein n=1 Tax=Ficus carica TaxID=3494 RepID=A0AA88CZN1_FICCA|nr:hypothetical protein TIFTF001_006368 [Ficus carica]